MSVPKLLFTLTLTITCTCCYDEIKGIQDPKIYSHADSLSPSGTAYGTLYDSGIAITMTSRADA